MVRIADHGINERVRVFLLDEARKRLAFLGGSEARHVEILDIKL